MACVSQETHLFSDTLKKNLIYGLQKEIKDDEIEEAISKAKLDEFVQKLPLGLETEIGDRGVKLSGGEKQRLAIARVFLKNPEILILDEATSALDSVTEKKIQQALTELIKGRTALIVAHRLSTIEHADKIIVLEKGEVREQGNFKELLNNKDIFFEYCQKQKFF